MAEIVWDAVGEKVFETGVDHGVLYIPDNTGEYKAGVPWNGLTTVTESPSGAESNKQYADNRVYINLLSAEEFGATIEAFYYPKAFEQCDGTAEIAPGVTIGQQGRKTFGLSYRTLLGDDVDGTDAGYKIHLIYGATAAPSEKSRATVNDSPEAVTFSWEVTTVAAEVGEVNGVVYKPTSHLTINSTEVSAEVLTALENVLYGTPGNTVGSAPRMPLPAEVYTLVTADATP